MANPPNKKYDLKLAPRPPKPDPHLPPSTEYITAYRKYVSVIKFMRQGMTEEEAVAAYSPRRDEPTGICHWCKGPARSKSSRACKPCIAEDARRRAIERRAKGLTVKEKTCMHPGCKAKFIGNPGRQNCDEHYRKFLTPRAPKAEKLRIPRERAKKAPVGSPRRDRVTLPKGWDTPRLKPIEFKPVEQPKPVSGALAVGFFSRRGVGGTRSMD